MRTAVIAFGLGLVLGCAPEEGANAAERCEQSDDCSAGLGCYRGFCVTEHDAASTPESASDDAAAPSRTPPLDARADAAVAATASDIAATDGSTSVPSATAQGDAATATAATQPEPAASAASGQNAPAPASATSPTASKPSAPAAAGPAMSADAGAEDDAAVEPPIPTRCTAAECCSEALAAGAPEDDKNSAGGKGEKAGAKTAAKSPGKSCGCSDPALLQTVACAVLGPLGVLL